VGCCHKKGYFCKKKDSWGGEEKGEKKRQTLREGVGCPVLEKEEVKNLSPWDLDVFKKQNLFGWRPRKKGKPWWGANYFCQLGSGYGSRC